MAKARAIMKRRKAVRNIKKITRTMQMIATAKFQKSLKRAVGTKPYTLKVRQLVRELASSVGNVRHPLLRDPAKDDTRTGRIALVVLTANRGLAGAYNGNVLKVTSQFLRQQRQAGVEVDLFVSGKKGLSFFNFLKRPVAGRIDVSDIPQYLQVEPHGAMLMEAFVSGKYDAVHVSYMNFISTGIQRAEVQQLLPLGSVTEAAENLARQLAEREAQLKAGVMDTKRTGQDVKVESFKKTELVVEYDFSPEPQVLLDALLPLTVKTAFFQAFLDASTSEHVARMVAMKSATDNADKMGKSLALEYNRARQSQITTELSEIMGGVEAMQA